MDVVFPRIDHVGPDPVAETRPSIVRVHKAADPDATEPTDDYYDVVEAYWSPIDKGKTNAAAVLTWLLGVVFQPINTTARYGGWAAKARSDVLSILAFIVLGSIAFVVCLIAFGNALAITLAHINPPAGGPPHTNLWLTIYNAVVTGWSRLWSSLSLLWNPTSSDVKALFAPAVLVRLALGAIGAFVLSQAVRAWMSVAAQRTALARIPVQLRSRRIATFVLFVIALVLMALCAFWRFDGGKQLGTVTLWLVISAGAFEFGKAAAASFIANFFGDVQIYCIHDQNAAFYALRLQILDVVMKTLVKTIKAAKPEYDRVYVFAHSLGSTVALDALMRIYNLRAESGVSDDEWNRIRGFVTFGTSLEKTRYFLDCYNSSFSASFAEWRDDYYGALFDPRSCVLEEPNGDNVGIYWANYWFFNDFIADRISTYCSFLQPGQNVSHSSRIRREVRDQLRARGQDAAVPMLVAQNRVSYRLPSAGHPIVHGDYLDSDWFWGGADESKPSWLARMLGTIPPRDPHEDGAIDVLDIVRSHERELTAAQLAMKAPGPPPVRPNHRVLTAAEAVASPLSDVLMR